MPSPLQRVCCTFFFSVSHRLQRRPMFHLHPLLYYHVSCDMKTIFPPFLTPPKARTSTLCTSQTNHVPPLHEQQQVVDVGTPLRYRPHLLLTSEWSEEVANKYDGIDQLGPVPVIFIRHLLTSFWILRYLSMDNF